MNAIAYIVMALCMIASIYILVVFAIMWAHDERPWRGPRMRL